jgi:hypothetical protein
MFVPVSCTSCGKPFQVPEATLGQQTPCPWCKAVVAALPVSAPTAQAPTEVLSLDDAEPSAPAPKPQPTPKPTPAPQPPREPVRVSARLAVALVLACVLAAGGTLVALRYGSGHIADSSWSAFAPPDNSFAIELPGAPTSTDVPANPPGSVGPGTRYSVSGWYSRTTVWVAHADLDPALVAKMKEDPGRTLSAGALYAERERERQRLGGTVTSEVTVRLNAAWGAELEMTTPRGSATVWLVLVDSGPKPRVYAVGVEGRGITGKSAAARRLFNSFRPAQ